MVAVLPLLLEVVALGFDVVGDAGLDCGFCAAVGVGGTDRAVLRNRDHVGEARRVPIDSGRGGEDDVGDIVAGHRGKEIDRAVDIGTVVF